MSEESDGINIVEEIAVKFFEGLHLKLPSASISAIFGQFRLGINDKLLLFNKYIPHAKYNADNCKFLLNVKFEDEELLKIDIKTLRKELNIISIKEFENFRLL